MTRSCVKPDNQKIKPAFRRLNFWCGRRESLDTLCLRATRNDFTTLHLWNLLGFEPSLSGSLPSPRPKNITDTLVGSISGAGEGNRTLVFSLGSWRAAIIPRPQRCTDSILTCIKCPVQRLLIVFLSRGRLNICNREIHRCACISVLNLQQCAQLHFPGAMGVFLNDGVALVCLSIVQVHRLAPILA